MDRKKIFFSGGGKKKEYGEKKLMPAMMYQIQKRHKK
jgi:hypothetical protein